MSFGVKLMLTVGFLAQLAYSTGGSPLAWKKLNATERQGVHKEVATLIGGELGPIYISFGTEPLRSTKNETYLFDVYSLHVPGSRLPYILLSAARTSNPLDRPPPFQTPPLQNVVTFERGVDRKAHDQPAVAFPSDQEYYKGVPVIKPTALRKISIKSSVVKKLRLDKETKSP